MSFYVPPSGRVVEEGRPIDPIDWEALSLDQIKVELAERLRAAFREFKGRPLTPELRQELIRRLTQWSRPAFTAARRRQVAEAIAEAHEAMEEFRAAWGEPPGLFAGNLRDDLEERLLTSGVGLALVCFEGGTGGIMPAEHHVPTPEGKRLRELRRRREIPLTLGEAARGVGLEVADFSGLEVGRYTLTEAKWAELYEAVAALQREGT